MYTQVIVNLNVLKQITVRLNYKNDCGKVDLAPYRLDTTVCVCVTSHYVHDQSFFFQKMSMHVHLYIYIYYQQNHSGMQTMVSTAEFIAVRALILSNNATTNNKRHCWNEGQYLILSSKILSFYSPPHTHTETHTLTLSHTHTHAHTHTHSMRETTGAGSSVVLLAFSTPLTCLPLCSQYSTVQLIYTLKVCD